MPTRIKIEKDEKLVVNLHDKREYMIQTKEAFKEALNHGLVLNKVNKVINFNQEAWSKGYIYINTDLRSNEKKMISKKYFSS